MTGKATQIIEAQVRKWEQRNESYRGTATTQLSHPVITISREFGAEGAALGRRLGEILGFDVCDDELLQLIAKETGSDEKLLESLDERRRELVEDTMAGLLKVPTTNVQYFRSLIKVVKTIEIQGNSIIVGRGSNHICTLQDALHVRVVCPLKQRIKQYADKNNLSIEEARQIVNNRDSERADFILHYFKKDIADASTYDIVVNSGSFTQDEMASIVIRAYEMKTGKKVKNFRS